MDMERRVWVTATLTGALRQTDTDVGLKLPEMDGNLGLSFISRIFDGIETLTIKAGERSISWDVRVTIVDQNDTIGSNSPVTFSARTSPSLGVKAVQLGIADTSEGGILLQSSDRNALTAPGELTVIENSGDSEENSYQVALSSSPLGDVVVFLEIEDSGASQIYFIGDDGSLGDTRDLTINAMNFTGATVSLSVGGDRLFGE